MKDLRERFKLTNGETISVEEFIKYFNKQNDFLERWTKKITKFLLNTDEKDLYILYDKYKNKLGRFEIYISYAFEEIGEELEAEGEFVVSKYKYKGFIVEYLIGQGSYISIYKI